MPPTYAHRLGATFLVQRLTIDRQSGETQDRFQPVTMRVWPAPGPPRTFLAPPMMLDTSESIDLGMFSRKYSLVCLSSTTAGS
eukprot:COSAG03_NODE_108_length_12558_cov_5.305081_15_plen_83_part_00